jgi:fumarate reductase subunit D
MSERRSIAPIFWLLFGAGGMLAAFVGPPLIILTGLLAPFGWPTTFADYDHVLAFARSPLGKLALLVVIALFVWHGAERLYLTLRDMRAGPHAMLQVITYGGAALVSVVTLVLLLLIGF